MDATGGHTGWGDIRSPGQIKTFDRATLQGEDSPRSHGDHGKPTWLESNVSPSGLLTPTL